MTTLPAPRSTLTSGDLDVIRKPLTTANAAFAISHPGEPTQRQPTHSVYGGAQLFQHDTAPRMGEHAPDRAFWGLRCCGSASSCGMA